MRIKLNVFFILFLFASYYAGRLPEMSVLFASILLHELGHVLAAKKMKVRVEEIEIYPFGSVARMEDVTKYGGFTEAVIAAAGPVTSGLLALLLRFLPFEGELLIRCAKYNAVLCFFNLLPFLPMDGGRILRNFLLMLMSYKRATGVLLLWGRVFALVLLGANAYLLLNGSLDITAAVVGVFIYLGSMKEAKYCSYYYLLSWNNRKRLSVDSRRIKQRIIKASPETYIRHLVNQFSPRNVCRIEVWRSSGELIASLSEAEVMEGFLKYGYDGKVRELIEARI